MRSLFQDVRYSLRMLLKKPGFTMVAALALAMGIGANSAIFSVINAILLEPLPFDDLDRIVALWERIPSQGFEHNEASVANYLDWRAQSNSFENLAICAWWSANLDSIEPPERARGFLASPNLPDLILAATGIYGVMAYAVSHRTREIGVRMALGAERADILKLLVIGHGMRMTAIGIVIGLAGAVGLAQAMKGMLFGAIGADWMTFAGVTLLLAGVSLLACYIPARRAAKVDPMVALRYE